MSLQTAINLIVLLRYYQCVASSGVVIGFSSAVANYCWELNVMFRAFVCLFIRSSGYR